MFYVLNWFVVVCVPYLVACRLGVPFDRGLDDRERWYLGWRRWDDRSLANSGLARALGSFGVRQQSEFDDVFAHACHPDCAGVGTRDGGRFIYCSLDDLGYRDSSSHCVGSIGHGLDRFLACPSFCIGDFLQEEGSRQLNRV